MTRDGCEVPVQRRILDLIVFLVTSRDRLVTRDEVFAAVWGDVHVSDHALSQAIYAARRAVESGTKESPIQTIRGRGFRFVGEVEEVSRSGPVAGPSGSILVGREGPRAMVAGALEDARRGRTRTVLLLGEAGIGKTSLLRELRRGLADELPLLVRFSETGDLPGFEPWSSPIRSLWSELGDRVVDRDLGWLAPALSRILPELAPPQTASEPSQLANRAARIRLFDAVATLVRTVARDQILVLMLDDVHRADEGSLALLLDLVREVDDAGLLVVGTFRELEAARSTACFWTLARLLREPAVQAVEIKPLTPVETARLLEARLGFTPSSAQVTALHAGSGGNPFFLEQLLALKADGAEGVHGHLPASVREAVLLHVAALPETVRSFLEEASVIGRRFRRSELEWSLARGTHGERVADALEAAQRFGLVRPLDASGTRFEFSHGLVRDALYGSLSARRRARAHQRVARALARTPATDPTTTLPLLAHHHYQASLDVVEEEAIEALARAARFEETRLSDASSAMHYRRLVDLLERRPNPDGPRLCEALLGLARSAMRAGERDAARTALRRASVLARDLGAAEQLARIGLEAAPGFFEIEVGGSDSWMESVLRESLEWLGPEPTALRARLLCRIAMLLFLQTTSEPDDRLLDEAREIGEALRDPKLDLYIRASEIGARWSPDTFAERRAELPELIERCRRLGDAERELIAYVFYLTTLLEAGDTRAFLRACEDFDARVEDLGAAHARWYIPLFRASHAAWEGRYDRARELNDRFRQVGERVQDMNAAQSYVSNRLAFAVLRGEAGALLPDARAMADRRPGIISWQLGIGYACAAAGGTEEARDRAEKAIRCGATRLASGRDMNWYLDVGLLAHICAYLGDSARASEVAERLEPFADRNVQTGYGVLSWGSVSRYLGALALLRGRVDEAIARYRFAIEQDDARGMRSSAAHARHGLARALATRGRRADRDAARAQRDCAVRELEDMAMPGAAARAGQALRGYQPGWFPD